MACVVGRKLAQCPAVVVLVAVCSCALVHLSGCVEARQPRGHEALSQLHSDRTSPAVKSVAGHGRELLDKEEDETKPYIVQTAQALSDAIAQGRRNIEIVAHLDLTTLPLLKNTGCGDGCDSPLPPINSLTKSIRGNCPLPPVEEDLVALAMTPGAVGLLPLQKDQCLVIAQEDNFRTMGHRLWIDNLYLRLAHDPDIGLREYGFITLAAFARLHWPLTGQGRRYVTRTTFQGDGVGPGVGIWAEENTYIENCTFANLGGDAIEGACADCTSSVVVQNATVAIVNSTFFDPVPFLGTTYVRTADAGGLVLISGCEFADVPNAAEELFYNGGNATFYADDESIRVGAGANSTGVAPVLPLSEVPEATEATARSNLDFPQRSDPWFRFRRQVVGQKLLPQATYPAPTTPVPALDIDVPPAEAPVDADADADADDAAAVDDDDDDGPSTGDIAAIILGVLFLLSAILLLVLCVRLRQARDDNGKLKAALSDHGKPPAQNGTAAPPPAVGAGAGLPWDKPNAVAGPSFARAPPPAPAMSIADPKTASTYPRDPWTGTDTTPSTLGMDDHSTDATAVGASSVLVLPVPPAGASVEERLAYMHMQLSSVGSEAKVLQQYKLLGSSHRLQGDRSIVAFATGAYDHEAYALKFFAVREAFDKEITMQRGSAVSALLPQVRGVHDPEAGAQAQAGGTDGQGQPLPPCIVYARGECLTQWLKRAKTDVFQAVSVLSHVATRLSEVHTAKYVHCDVKPAHILLLQRQNRWTVIDFDHATPIGTPVAPAHTLDYAAPEVVAAVSAREPIAAAPSMDAWAVGVIAFELLTGKKALNSAKDGTEAVEAQLRGDAELPWEGDRLSEATRRKLGVFGDTVLGMLCRDPEERATMKDLCSACDNVVTSQTTMGPGH